MHTLYTIGYSGWPLDAFDHAVAEAGTVLVDTRLRPWSWKPGFKKRELADRYGAAGYRHMSALGNANYKTGGPVRLAGGEEGLVALRHLLEAGPVVIMCGCAVLDACHRRFIADAMVARYGTPVRHIPPPEAPA